MDILRYIKEVIQDIMEYLVSKSRASWIEASHNNTKFFHQYSNFRKFNNTIWEIEDEHGNFVKYFKDKIGAYQPS